MAVNDWYEKPKYTDDPDVPRDLEKLASAVDVEFVRAPSLGSLQETVEQEIDTRAEEDARVLTEAKAYTDQETIANQIWLPAVETKAELTAPTDPTKNYLCRVINDSTTSNNGVWQWIAGAEEWTYFSDNLDFVDEAELNQALADKITEYASEELAIAASTTYPTKLCIYPE
jgi:hypothetical protein